LVERLISSLAACRPAGRALDAAIVALRRGEAVLLCGRGETVLALAAEFVDDGNLQRLRQVSARRLDLVLTRRRAVALGLALREVLSGAVSITLTPELPAAVIRNLADPAASLGVEPPLAPSRQSLRAANSPPWRSPSSPHCCQRQWSCRSPPRKPRPPGGAPISPSSTSPKC
jgi:hypothetical protein